MRYPALACVVAAGCLVDNPAWVAAESSGGASTTSTAGSVDTSATSTAGDVGPGSSSSPMGSSGPGVATFGDTGQNPDSWWDSAYPFRRQVQLHPELSFSGNPLTVRVDIDGELPPPSPDGPGLAFISGESNVLQHEVEYFAESTGTVWLRLDGVGDESIHMYYGANLPSPPTKVIGEAWAENYLAIWHMASGLDASGHGNDLLQAPPWGEPVIGRSGSFGAGFPGVAALEGEGLGLEKQAVTIMAWIRPSPVGGFRPPILHRQSEDATRGFSFFYEPMRASIGVSLGWSDTPELWYPDAPAIELGKAYQVAVVVQERIPTLFTIDGTGYEPLLDQEGLGEPLLGIGEPVFVGGDANGMDPFEGNLDEVRVYFGGFTAEGLRQEFLAQSADATELGPEEMHP